MIPIPTDETLMAYADGELDVAVAGALEAAMVRDPLLVIRTVEFLKSRRLARANFAETSLPSPSPAALEAVLTSQLPTGAGKQSGSWRGSSLRLLAACVILGVGALAGSLLLSPAGTKAGFSALAQPQMSQALNEVASGSTVNVAGGFLRAIATVVLQDKRLCRQIEFNDTAGITGAVVCRSAGRSWEPVLAMSVSSHKSDFRPAAGNKAFDRFFDDEGAGTALEGAAERQALSRN